MSSFVIPCLHRCWYCNGTVEKPETVSDGIAKNSLLRFNEQVFEIYTVLQQYEGVQFSPKTQSGRATDALEVLLFSVYRPLLAFQCSRFKVHGKRTPGIVISVSHGGGVEEAVEPESRGSEPVPWLQDEESKQYDFSSLVPSKDAPLSGITIADSSMVQALTISLASSDSSSSSSAQPRPDVMDLQHSGPNESEVERLLQNGEGLCGYDGCIILCLSQYYPLRYRSC